MTSSFVSAAEPMPTLRAPASITASTSSRFLMPPPMHSGTVQSAAALRIISRFVRRPSSLALMSSIQISSAPSSQ